MSGKTKNSNMVKKVIVHVLESLNHFNPIPIIHLSMEYTKINLNL